MSQSPSRGAPFRDGQAANAFLNLAFKNEMDGRPEVVKAPSGFAGWGAPKGGLLADSKTDFLSALSVAYVKAGGAPPTAGAGAGAGWAQKK
ncbi:hypothetical protein RQP46_003070 [Phenoliferia psychrophenolica]